MDDELDEEREVLEGEMLPMIPTFRDSARRREGVVMVETGRNKAVPAPVGANLDDTIDQIAERANYGGDYRVFINGSEILSAEEYPRDMNGNQVIQAGMRIAISSYDKPGK